MPKAKKLKSGSWNVMVFSHMENGKRKYVSITAPSKAEAELKAAEFKSGKHRRTIRDYSVEDCIKGYIAAKEGVLSPSTLREYHRMLDDDFNGLLTKRVRQLTSEDLQTYVSFLAEKLSPKTVRNRYGLVKASISFYYPDIVFKVTLPAKTVRRPVSPSDDMVGRLIAEANPRLKPCIALAMCGMRRGEIAALKYEDIKDGCAHIHADMVQGMRGKWIYKELPKTEGSDRILKLPAAVLEIIGTGSGFIVQLNPNSIGQAFGRLAKRLGYDISLHGLRHFYASTGVALSIPDLYMADMGGWSRAGNAPVMKSVYQNNILSLSDYYADRMNSHLDEIIKKEGVK